MFSTDSGFLQSSFTLICICVCICLNIYLFMSLAIWWWCVIFPMGCKMLLPFSWSIMLSLKTYFYNFSTLFSHFRKLESVLLFCRPPNRSICIYGMVWRWWMRLLTLNTIARGKDEQDLKQNFKDNFFNYSLFAVKWMFYS